MDKYYRVEQSERGQRRSILCGATSEENATARLHSIVENMLANGWKRSDEDLIKKLATAVILENVPRKVTLAVKECTAEDVTSTKLDLREMPWLVRAVSIEPAYNCEDTRELFIGEQTPTDGLFDMRDGTDDYQQESAVAS